MALHIVPTARSYPYSIVLLALLAGLTLACGPIAHVVTTTTGGLPAAPIATGELAMQPTTYTAKWDGATYSGWHAQVLHQLFAVVPGYATTYADHNRAGGGLSADLWADGAGYGTNNSGMQSMDMLAAYIATNMRAAVPAVGAVPWINAASSHMNNREHGAQRVVAKNPHGN